MIADMAQEIADLAEDLSIEILSEFRDEDLPHMEKTLDRLERAERRLTELDHAVPPTVDQLLRKFRRASQACH